MNATSRKVSREELSDGELELLRQLESGHSNAEISRALNLSVGTVKTLTNNLYRKLGVRNRAEAVATAKKLQLL
jgi:ATP/maltotriose-dependent transcriptional regulator MalT